MLNARELNGRTEEPSLICEMISTAFRDHSAAIRGSALRLTRDPEVAADVTQEAFLRLFGEAQAGRIPDNVGGWLYRTTANLVISRARRAAVARRFEPRLVRFDGPPEPDALAILNEQYQELQLGLTRLSATERVALTMAANGASGEEIAVHLGRSRGATRTLLSRARTHLRTALVSFEPARDPAAPPLSASRSVAHGCRSVRLLPKGL